ncbi:MAG: FAD-dependent oxidoreductase [Deltaproteobacteria bacterium]|nr:FAD-dependent oxidoreductase [Deltaproteobacteria bacterium]
MPGAVVPILLRLGGAVPLHTAAQVLYADAASFTLGSVAGHVEAGWIHFDVRPEGDHAVLRVQSLGRGADPLYEAGLRLFGHAGQERFWRATLERAAAWFDAPAEVEVSTVRVDRRLHWEAAPNLLRSAALREPLALFESAAPAPTPRPERPRIVIVGGGYGGLACLRALSGRLPPSRFDLRLLDATPDHTVKTRFHERAVLEGREALVRLPLSTLAAASGARFVEDEVVGVDLEGRRVRGRRGEYGYDRLVLALGGRIAYFGVEGAAEHTVSLQTHAQAVECCRRVAALRGEGPGAPKRRLVVVGAGIEGLEVATMLRQELPPGRFEVVVLDRGANVMAQSQCGDAQREYAKSYLERRGISLRLGAAILSVGPDHVVLAGGERLPSDLTVWCSGVVPAGVPGLPEPLRVGPDLQMVDHPGVFAVGDFATVESPQPEANLRSAQRAAYHGELVGENLWRLETGRPLKHALYRPVGELVALGDFDGVGVAFGAPLTGLRAALLKKAHEGKYLADTLSDVPGAAARGALAMARGRAQHR